MSGPDNQSTAVAPALHMLPDDVDSPQFAEGLRLLKDSYADRTSFNHFVCEELALRGISPNSRNVLKYGRWGQSVAVAADVRSWFANVARRLSARHGNIPDVAQKRFIELGEQFWALAQEQVGKPLKDELLRVQDVAAQELSTLQSRLDATCTARDRSELRFQAQVRDLSAHVESLERRLQEASEALAKGQLEARLSLERALGAEKALEMAAANYEARVGEIQQAALADKAARELAHKDAIELLRSANERLETMEKAARRDAAAQVDKARQDARLADERARQEQTRADAIRGELDSAREQLMNKSVEHARAVHDQELLRTQVKQGQQAAAQYASQEAGKAAKLAREDTLLELAQSAGSIGIELRVPPTAKRPEWIDARTWKSFAAIANASKVLKRGG